MPGRIPRKCLHPGCPVIGTFEGPYCPDHVRSRKNERTAARFITNTAAWRHLTESLRAQGNVICQHVDGFGVRCKEKVWGFHHVLAVASRKDLALHQLNCVGLCHDHHNAVEFGDPSLARYVPTMWRAPMSYEPLPAILVMPGAKATDAQAAQLWSLAERMRFFGSD